MGGEGGVGEEILRRARTVIYPCLRFRIDTGFEFIAFAFNNHNSAAEWKERVIRRRGKIYS